MSTLVQSLLQHAHAGGCAGVRSRQIGPDLHISLHMLKPCRLACMCQAARIVHSCLGFA